MRAEKPVSSADHRLIDPTQTAWGKSRNILRSQQVRDRYARVAAYARRLRQARGPARRRPRQSLSSVAEPVYQPLTPRRATWLVLRREAKRTAAEAQQLTQLHTQSAEVAEAIDLAQDFAQLLREHQPEHLEPWLKRATMSTLEALQRFASGLRDDYEAIKAGVTLPWSTSPVEGHINRLKMLKRQMFGRARLDLLSRRFVRAPREGQVQAVGPTRAITDARRGGVAPCVASGVASA